MMAISASVGSGGKNLPLDVQYVQALLNTWLPTAALTSLDLDGKIGPKTIDAIREFQQNELGFADGLVDPGHNTVKALEARIALAAEELFAFSAFALALSYVPPETEGSIDEERPLHTGELIQLFNRVSEVE